MAATAAMMVLLLRASGRADAPGFFGLGTRQADINITLELLLVAGLTFGSVPARRGSIDAHRFNQTHPHPGYCAVALLGIATYRVWYA